MRVTAPRDFLAGLMFASIGAFFLWFSYDYRMGSAVRMGPGYMPWWLGLILILLGLAIAGRAFVREGPWLERLPIRPLFIIVSTLVVFGLMVRWAGLIAAIMTMVVLSSFAMRERPRLIPVAATAIVLAAFSAAIFVHGLGVPIPLLPRG